MYMYVYICIQCIYMYTIYMYMYIYMEIIIKSYPVNIDAVHCRNVFIDHQYFLRSTLYDSVMVKRSMSFYQIFPKTSVSFLVFRLEKLKNFTSQE